LSSPSSSYPLTHRAVAIIVNFVARRAVAIDFIIVVIVIVVAPSSLPSSSSSRHRRLSPSSSPSYPVAPPDQHGVVVFGCSLKRT
jgi:hypothetical protein